MNKTGRSPRGKYRADAALGGVVVTVSVRVCEAAPGVIVAVGVNDAVAPAGSGAAATNVMGFENVALEGATIRLKMPGCPGFTVAEEFRAVTV